MNPAKFGIFQSILWHSHIWHLKFADFVELLLVVHCKLIPGCQIMFRFSLKDFQIYTMQFVLQDNGGYYECHN